ncbi:MAG: hypothetical protein ACOCYN_03850 [Planctomycetota bacterium]
MSDPHATPVATQTPGETADGNCVCILILAYLVIGQTLWTLLV